MQNISQDFYIHRAPQWIIEYADFPPWPLHQKQKYFSNQVFDFYQSLGNFNVGMVLGGLHPPTRNFEPDFGLIISKNLEKIFKKNLEKNTKKCFPVFGNGRFFPIFSRSTTPTKNSWDCPCFHVLILSLPLICFW